MAWHKLSLRPLTEKQICSIRFSFDSMVAVNFRAISCLLWYLLCHIKMLCISRTDHSAWQNWILRYQHLRMLRHAVARTLCNSFDWVNSRIEMHCVCVHVEYLFWLWKLWSALCEIGIIGYGQSWSSSHWVIKWRLRCVWHVEWILGFGGENLKRAPARSRCKWK
jgi:hypothetical protein